MKPYTVIVAPFAQNQITEQTLYIARDSVDNALALESRIRSAIEKIGKVAGYATDQDASDRLGILFTKLYLSVLISSISG